MADLNPNLLEEALAPWVRFSPSAAHPTRSP